MFDEPDFGGLMEFIMSLLSRFVTLDTETEPERKDDDDRPV